MYLLIFKYVNFKALFAKTTTFTQTLLFRAISGNPHLSPGIGGFAIALVGSEVRFLEPAGIGILGCSITQRSHKGMNPSVGCSAKCGAQLWGIQSLSVGECGAVPRDAIGSG